MSEKVIADALGLRSLEEIRDEEPTEKVPVIVHEEETAIVPATSAQDEVLDDIELARNNIKDIITKGGESLEEMIMLAKQSESPRAFEVATNMMKMLIDANKDFVGMSEKKKFAKEDSPAQQTQNNVTNNNLILSTTDLLKMLKGETP